MQAGPEIVLEMVRTVLHEVMEKELTRCLGAEQHERSERELLAETGTRMQASSDEQRSAFSKHQSSVDFQGCVATSHQLY